MKIEKKLFVYNEVSQTAEIIGAGWPAGRVFGRRTTFQNLELSLVIPHNHHFTLAPLKSGLKCRLAAHRRPMTNDPDLGIMPGELLRYLARSVRRAVVNNQQLEPLDRIGQNIKEIIYGRGQRRLGIIDRQQYGQRALHERILSGWVKLITLIVNFGRNSSLSIEKLKVGNLYASYPL